jgi:hypothetical protein
MPGRLLPRVTWRHSFLLIWLFLPSLLVVALQNSDVVEGVLNYPIFMCLYCILYANLSLGLIHENFLGLHFFQHSMSGCRCCWLGAWVVHRPGIYIPHYVLEKNQKKKVRYNWIVFTQNNHSTKHQTPEEIQTKVTLSRNGRLTYKIKIQYLDIMQ